MKEYIQPIIRDRYIYILSLILCLTTYGICSYFDVMQYFTISIYSKYMLYALMATAFLYLLFYYFYLAFNLTPNPFRKFKEKIIQLRIYKHEIINLVLIFISLSFVLSCFTSLKTAISQINPYYLDPLLSQIDLKIHFGIPPWEITHFLFPSEWATAIINFFYNIWFFVIWIFFSYSACQFKNPVQREQMLISICLVWFINGGILAILLSSGGPVYAQRLFPDMSQYKDLMLLLEQQNQYLLQHNDFFYVWSLNTQQMLWDSYSSQTLAIGAGISAMPSVHVSATTLIALSVSKINKNWGIIAWLYLLIIFIGSIHLGWHYAGDGYLGFILTVVIWKAVGRWQRGYSPLITQSLN